MNDYENAQRGSKQQYGFKKLDKNNVEFYDCFIMVHA